MKKMIESFFASQFSHKVFTIIGLMFFFWFCMCDYCHGEIKREGKTFVQVSTRGSKAEPTATPYTYTDSKGKSYPIFLTVNGRAYVNKVSGKTGNTYKYYLPEDVARQICSEMGVEYKEKQTKKAK